MSSMKKLVIGFLSGLLLMGLGGGIAFAEFSAFDYAGVKTLDDTQDLQKKSIETEVAADGRPMVIRYYTGDHSSTHNVQVVADQSLDQQTMVLEVAYRPEVASVNVSVDRGIMQNADDEEENDGASSQRQKKDYYYISVYQDPFSFLQYMDTFLQDVKDRQFYDYKVQPGADLVVRVAPENVDRVQK